MGANIGTTGIYFLKKFAPNLKLIAFEPSAENFKLLRINTILNDMEDKATLVNCGLGDKFDEMTMYVLPQDYGCNSVIAKYFDGQPTETIKIIPLDAYLAENKIAASQVKYIWIDTEGFEAQVLLGAKNLLTQNPAPIFMECNPKAWKNSGSIDKMITLLKKVGYTGFIPISTLLETGKEEICPFENLFAIAKNLEKSSNILGRVGDIFLIRKGKIG